MAKLKHVGGRHAGVRFHKSFIPKSLRGTAAVKSLVGVPILKLLGPDLNRLDQQLIEIFRSLPILSG